MGCSERRRDVIAAAAAEDTGVDANGVTIEVAEVVVTDADVIDTGGGISMGLD